MPLYYLTTLGVFAIGLLMPSFLHTVHADAVSLLKSLLFIPFYPENLDTPYPLYPITWTITVEVFVCIVYFIPLSLLKIEKLRRLFQNHEKHFKAALTSLLLCIPMLLYHILPKNAFTDA